MQLLLVAVLGMTWCASLVEAPRQDLDMGPEHVPARHAHGGPIATAATILRTKFRANKASGVLLDWKTGATLASIGDQPTATPGSLLKPLLLSYALQRHIVAADTTVYCRRALHVANRSLPCTHPTDQPMLNAEGALAASCNTWFASLARRMTAQQLDEVLQQAHLPHTSERFNDADARVMTALGLENVSTSALELGTAYRALFLREPRTSAVWNGLRDSVAYGMANNARVRGAEVLGKTGTASNAREWWTHGWFVGGVPDRFVLVVYVPHGDGGVAAKLAGEAMQELLSEDVR